MVDTTQPKVSVITGYYNRVEAVDLTISSILSQTYENLELIAFDDCSTDGTADRLIALRNELNDPRFRVVLHERNKGFTQGMIDAVRLSKGQYICVQGSGDVSLPDRVAHQVALLDRRPDVGAVGCWYTNVVETSGVRRPRTPSADGITFSRLLRGNVFSHGEVMMRREIYEKAGGYRAAFKFSQDLDLWLRIVRLANLATVPEFLYERHVRFDGVSYQPQKFASQIRYSLLARRINTLPAQESNILLERLAAEGPHNLIPNSDPELQRLCLRAVLRSMVFGGEKNASELSDVVIDNPLIKRALKLTISLYGIPQLSALRQPLLRALGVSEINTEIDK